MTQTLPQRYGKYVLLRRVAVGGMAEIFRAKAVGAEGFERDIAIKRILPNYTADDSFVQMFKDEANIAAKLNHANIVQIFDFDIQGGTYYIAMEFIEGKDLKQITDAGIGAGRPVPPIIVCKIIGDVCAALHYAHTKKHRDQALNIVHRDVSPHNIMVSYNGDVKLMDFGIAKAKQRFTQTQAGLVKGKCAYMSPEQVRGKQLDGRSDVFALGVVMWEMLTHRRLFAGDTDYVTLSNVVKAEVQPAREVNPKIPEALDAILLRALTRNPDDRYATAAEFQRELQKFYFMHAADAQDLSLADYMQDVFAGEIREMARLQAEERNSFTDFMESAAASGTSSHAAQAEAKEPSSPRTPGGSGLSAPRPASLPPPRTNARVPTQADAPPVTLREGPPGGRVDQVASTVPLADIQKQVQARLSASQDIPLAAPAVRRGTRSAIDYAPREDDLLETMAMTALPQPKPGSGSVRTPASSGTGLAQGRTDSKAVRSSGGRGGLFAVLALLLVGLAVGAYFLFGRPSGETEKETPTPTSEAKTPPTTSEEPDAGSVVVAAGGADAKAAAGDVPREAPLHAARVTLRVETDPADAAVSLDGKAQTSRTIEGLEAGREVVVRAEKAGFVAAEQKVALAVDMAPVRLVLQPAGAPDVEMTIATTVPAQISVDGKPLGQSPVKVRGKPTQRIYVEAKASGYKDFANSYEIDASKPLNVELQKLAQLVIDVEPAQAVVAIGERKLEAVAGRPGHYEVTTLAVGESVQLRVSAPKYKAETKQLTLTASDSLRFDLKKAEERPPQPPPVATGNVDINAKPWADVYWKGRKVGTTRFRGSFPVGEQVFVLKKGDLTKRVTLNVQTGRPASTVVDMNQ